MKTKDVAMATMIASLYTTLNILILPYTFGLIQCRIGDLLYPMISILGMPALIGCFVGHFVFNFIGYSMGIALGELDLIVSPLLFLIPKYIIYRYKNRPEIGTILHIIFVSLWVPFLLNLLYGAPILMSIVLVGSGEMFAEGIIGLSITELLRKYNIMGILHIEE